MRELSIEYAHIYTNMHVEEEHETSTALLAEVMADYTDRPEDTSLVVMVDDYSFPDPTFDYDDFSAWLDKSGYKPDVLIRESQLIPVCDAVIRMVEDETLKAQLIDYIKAKKYPCSLFIAAWYLLRLGKIESSIFPKSFSSEKLINILPESFKPFEDKGLEIISKTRFGNAVESIDYKFIAGRLIA